MKSTFYLAFHTNELYTVDEYTKQSGEFVNVLQELFTDSSKIELLTNQAVLDACNCETEIVQEEDGMTCKCVLDFEAEARVSVDKAKLTALIKSKVMYPKLKIEKRLVVEKPV